MRQNQADLTKLYPRKLSGKYHPPSKSMVLWIWSTSAVISVVSGRWDHGPKAADGSSFELRPTHWAPWPSDFPVLPVPEKSTAFSVGQEVNWISRNRQIKLKIGVVVAVVEAGAAPMLAMPAGLRRRNAFGNSRPSKSYLVSSGKVVYWPRCSSLHLTGRKFSKWLAATKKLSRRSENNFQGA